MKVLLVAVNAKYIHTCPAIYSLKAFAEEYADISAVIETAEYTINDRYQDVLSGVMSHHADIIGFSTYIWNVDRVRQLIRDIRAVRGRDVMIWAGGPEASNEPEPFLMEDGADLCMIGEGEEVFTELLRRAGTVGTKTQPESKPRLDLTGLSGLQGVAFLNRVPDETPGPAPEVPVMISTGYARPVALDRIPFLYQDLTLFHDRIVYYEASRGCPFACAYCLSGKERGVRHRDLTVVEKELQFFLDHNLKQVKFVDRTFNADEAFAMHVWTYIRDHDNGITNFHFEIEAARLTKKEIQLVSTMRPGLIQMEIGVQSANPETLRSVNRNPDLSRIREAMIVLTEKQNINLHLDLIAGLPFEDYESFRNSFNVVYDMNPHQLQVGFLKLLRGTRLYEKREAYGLVCSADAPYEVLQTRWISYEELDRLRRISDRVEEYVNSQGFRRTLALAVRMFSDPFGMFEELEDWYRTNGYDTVRVSAQHRYEIFGRFIQEMAAKSQEVPEELAAQTLEMLRFDRNLHIHPARHMVVEDEIRLNGEKARYRFDHRRCSPVNKEACFERLQE